MRTKFTILISFLFLSLAVQAQDVVFSFANATQTMNGGNTFYDVDVMASTSSPFILGSGQLYFDYNPAAFGNSIQGSGNLTITTSGFVLGTVVGFPFYNNPVINDNTVTRFSISWQQALSSSCIGGNNITATPTALFHITIQYTGGGTAFDPGVCFTSAPPFDDQTFTACGPSTGACGFADCGGNPGTQITNDAFDCANAPLPLDLLGFDVRKDKAGNAFVYWNTANEVNTSHFEVERSLDTDRWSFIGEVAAAGFSRAEQRYNYLDEEVKTLSPYSREAYYRLRMVDVDGKFTYSEIKSIRLEGEQRVSVYPNPATDFVYVKPQSDDFRGTMELQLINTSGKTMWSAVVDFSQNEEFIANFGNRLTAGVYYLTGKDQYGVEFAERIVIMRE